MKNILAPGVGSGAIALNWVSRVPIVIEGCVVIGMDICAERIIDGRVVGKILSHYMARLKLLVLDRSLEGRTVSPGGLTLGLNILHVWIAGAGVGDGVHIGYSGGLRRL